MNSAADLQENLEANIVPDPDSPDSNANGSTRSKGTKKTSVKLNNNIENMSTLNSPEEGARCNGSRYPESYLEASCSTHHHSETTSESEPENNVDSEAETELMSGSDDGCIYTYKGDHTADLPNSFFCIPPPDPPAQNLLLLVDDAAPNRQEASSPEMDFLEMDFDPSNNGDIDSASDNEFELNIDPQNAVKQRQDVVECTTQPVDPGEGPSHAFNGTANASSPQKLKEDNLPSTSAASTSQTSSNCVQQQKIANTKQRLTEPSPSVDECYARRPNFEPAMVWSTEEALSKEASITDGANCAATAVLSVLTALRIPMLSVERIAANTTWRRSARCPTLAKYLISKSQAGSTPQDIINGLRESSNGAVEARFFPMFPERVINFNNWLAYWIENGVIPIATLNMEQGGEPIGHAWHHQMIYGVDEKGVFLMNPHKYVETDALWPKLSSDSVLKVQRSDVLSRWNFRTDLLDLMRIDDIRWQNINVVGQVANMIHESNRPLRVGLANTTYIRIPSIYAAGITLAAIVNTPGWHLLNQARELPILTTSSIPPQNSDVV